MTGYSVSLLDPPEDAHIEQQAEPEKVANIADQAACGEVEHSGKHDTEGLSDISESPDQHFASDVIVEALHPHMLSEVEHTKDADTTTASQLFATKLKALKADGRELAKLHREAQQSAASRLPRIGSLVDAEEDLLDALGNLCTLSPLLLVDGAQGVGKSSFINAMLSGADDYSSSSASSPLPVGRPGSRRSRPIIVRPPLTKLSVGRRFLEGKPSLGENAEASMQLLTDEQWIARFGGSPAIQVSRPACIEGAQEPPSGLNDSVSPLQTEHNVQERSTGTVDEDDAPLILEDARCPLALGTSLWLAEVDVDDGSAKSNWVSDCGDVVCVVRVAGGGALSVADEERVRRHVDAGRSVFLIVNQCDVELDPPVPSLPEVEVLVRNGLSDILSDPQASFRFTVRAVSILRACRHTRPLQSIDDAVEAEAAPQGHWADTWRSCCAEIHNFAANAEDRRLSEARQHLKEAREAFVHWCSTGAKVVVAANHRFQEDADTVRRARDLITRNIDAAYLAHVFTSVLVGKFDEMCSDLMKLPAPDLGSTWGRNSTKGVMEGYLKNELEARLRKAMVESLEEVTAEMAKQELPALEEIRRVAQRGTDVPWDAEVRKLELDLRPDQLHHFAMHFFGSVAVGVLSGLGAAVLEMFLAELVLGPVGVVVGIATFIAIGAQSSDWPKVREAFVKQVRSRHLELVLKARAQLDFPGLCERRKRRILERMDIVLQRLLAEVASLSESASEFAQCALVLQTSSRWKVPC
jgi:hypothetical protein